MTYQESLEYEALLREYAAGKVSVEEARKGFLRLSPTRGRKTSTCGVPLRWGRGSRVTSSSFSYGKGS